ncbi:hypothetical protein SAMN04488128_10725 [Chitinophaga eiseniae]|uniref:Uncharacterized protein n=1 Tax=Chitinophaga eiseniae TaxID=634771 RepID=A0A1T4TYG3_9BACT|nr:hypothetical protein SAMN04488128_10725 [Chitinophaga eiseniae]
MDKHSTEEKIAIRVEVRVRKDIKIIPRPKVVKMNLN